MFISRSSHLATIKHLNQLALDQQEVLRQGYHSRIRALENHIEDLRSLVFPKTPQAIDPMVMEADSVMSASDKPIHISEKEHNEMIQGMREADLLISGNYSEDLLE